MGMRLRSRRPDWYTEPEKEDVAKSHTAEAQAAIRKREQRKYAGKKKLRLKNRLGNKAKVKDGSKHSVKQKLHSKSRRKATWEPGMSIPEAALGKANAFSGIPNFVLESEAYRDLDSICRDVLMYARWQYRGHNNGKLTLTLRGLREEWNWPHARNTLRNCIKKILLSGLLLQTRKPYKRRAGTYSLAWETNRMKVDDL